MMPQNAPSLGSQVLEQNSGRRERYSGLFVSLTRLSVPTVSGGGRTDPV